MTEKLNRKKIIKEIKNIENIENIDKNLIRSDFKREKFTNKKFIKKGKFRKKYSHYSKERKYNFDNKKSANY